MARETRGALIQFSLGLAAGLSRQDAANYSTMRFRDTLARLEGHDNRLGERNYRNPSRDAIVRLEALVPELREEVVKVAGDELALVQV